MLTRIKRPGPLTGKGKVGRADGAVAEQDRRRGERRVVHRSLHATFRAPTPARCDVPQAGALGVTKEGLRHMNGYLQRCQPTASVS